MRVWLLGLASSLIGRQANNRNVIEPFTINWTTIDGSTTVAECDSHIWGRVLKAEGYFKKTEAIQFLIEIPIGYNEKASSTFQLFHWKL